jgi:hypothetical protein
MMKAKSISNMTDGARQSCGLFKPRERGRLRLIRAFFVISFALCSGAFSVEVLAQGGWTATGPGEPTPAASGKPGRERQAAHT